MSALSIQPTYPILTDIDGQPLENGFVWVGTANLDPQANPITAYWDAALTQVATQPVRTRGGYPLNGTSVGRLYVNSDYSILVQNRNGATVYSAPAATERYGNIIISAADVSYLPSGTGAEPTTVQTKLRETVSVKDFGAVGDGVADDAPAVQLAIAYLFANNKSALYFPAGTYYFDSPVVVNFDAENGLRLYGEGMANYMFFDVGGTRIIGKAGIESLFIFTRTDLATAGGYSFECSGIYFKSGNNGTTGPLTALKNKIGGAPARPFIVENCGFLDFDKCIVSDLSGTSGLTTGICQVIIRKNTFVSSAYALYGSGGLGNIMDLVFCDNVSENGGSIYVDGLGGTFNISDNILEGQVNAIQLTAGLAVGEISRNYFESNSGYLMRFVATNPNSQIRIGEQYILNSAGALVTVQNAYVECSTNFESAGVIAGFIYTDGKSVINNGGVLRASELPLESGGIAFLDLNCVPKLTSVAPSTLTQGAYYSPGGAQQFTPIGLCDVATVTGNGNLITAPSISLNSGDWIVAMCLARKRSNAAIVYAVAYDNAGSTIGNSDTSQTIRNAAIGEWVFMLHWVKVSASSAGAPKFRWVTSGGSVDVTQTYLYKVASPAGGTALYYCLPALTTDPIYKTIENSKTFTLAPSAYTMFFFVEFAASGESAICYTSWGSATISFLGTPPASIAATATPTSTQLGISKSSSSYVVSFTSGSNLTPQAGVAVTFLGATITARTDWV